MRGDLLLPSNAQDGARMSSGQHGPGTNGKTATRKPGCVAVARKRAHRYARRHHGSRLLWPLIAAYIFVTLLIERWPGRTELRRDWRSSRDDHDANTNAVLRAQGTEGQGETSTVPSENGGAVDGDPQPRYRPPPTFFEKNVTQIVAFLIRNRGRLDTDTVRMKWSILDEASLPLAVYLRDIEASGAWHKLDAETRAVPEEHCVLPTLGMPRSLRHRKLLVLLPEWIARGQLLMASVSSDGMVVDPSPDLVPDNPETTSWKP